MIISISVLLAFIATVLVIEATPGPNMGWLAIVSASEGRKSGLAAVAGVGLGLLLIGLAAAAGLGALVLASPLLFQGLRFAGAAYLLWLAYNAWRDAGEPSPKAHGGEALNLGKHFRRGLIVNLLNPKAAVFYVAILPGFTDTAAPVAPQVFTLTLVYVALATLVHAGLVMFAANASAFLEDPVRMRRTRRALAVLIAVIAVWFLVSAGL